MKHSLQTGIRAALLAILAAFMQTLPTAAAKVSASVSKVSGIALSGKNVWLATKGGIISLNTVSGKSELYALSNTEISSALGGTDNDFLSICTNGEEIWAGSSHNGVVRMIPVYPDVVETSSNLAIIDIGAGKAEIKILARSSREDMKEYVATQLESCFNMAGMKTVLSGSYGGWDPNPDSEILHLLEKIYKEQNGKEATVQVDHAGLECSVILGKYPNLDVVSLGPTLLSPHTTNERFEISTAEPFWNLLTKALEEIPERK